MSSLDYWDTHIRPYLARIRLRSNALRYDVAMLGARPDFDTWARSDLEHVSRELARAKERVDRAIADYDAKPCDVDVREAA